MLSQKHLRPQLDQGAIGILKLLTAPVPRLLLIGASVARWLSVLWPSQATIAPVFGLMP
jgi:hypothetical protein